MIVDIVHEAVSFRQSKWLENYIRSNTQKKMKQGSITERTSKNC